MALAQPHLLEQERFPTDVDEAGHSSDTVIHTPGRRKSSAFYSAAAEELFAHGINFIPTKDITELDRSAPNAAQRRPSGQPESDILNAPLPGIDDPPRPQRRQSALPMLQKRRKSVRRQIWGSAGSKDGSPQEHGEGVQPMSFLGVHSREADPGGADPATKSASTLITTTTGCVQSGTTSPRGSIPSTLRSCENDPAATATHGATSVRLLDATKTRVASLSLTADGPRALTFRQAPRQVEQWPRLNQPQEELIWSPLTAQEVARPLLALPAGRRGHRQEGAGGDGGADGTEDPFDGHGPPLLTKSSRSGRGRENGNQSLLRTLSVLLDLMQVAQLVWCLMRRLARCYWETVKPCFDGRSAIRRRWHDSCSRPEDCLVFCMAYLGLLVGIVMMIKAWRVVVWAWLLVEDRFW